MDDDESGTESARNRLLRSLVRGVLQGLAEASKEPPAAAATIRGGDVVLGVGAFALEASRRVSEGVGLAVRPLAAMLRPPARLRRRPSGWLHDLAGRGRAEREVAALRLEALGRRLAPQVLDAALGLVDVTGAVRDHVDLDEIVAGVDLDAVVSRVDMEAVLGRLDIDAIAARLDLDAVLARLDLDAVLGRLDLDAVVARVDVEAILERVDIDAIAARLDVDAVLGRLDLIALAELVVEGIDLPGIIQSSTGSMASEAVRQVRWQGIGADERVAQAVDRMLGRRAREPGTPGAPGKPGTPGAPGKPGAPTSPEPPAGEDTPAQGRPPPDPDTDQHDRLPPPAGYGQLP
jgi:hypothetical protein